MDSEAVSSRPLKQFLNIRRYTQITVEYTYTQITVESTYTQITVEYTYTQITFAVVCIETSSGSPAQHTPQTVLP